MTYHTKITDAGSPQEILLADESRIWLNTMSQVKYPSDFNNKAKILWLQGEAFFEVSRSVNKIFMLSVADLLIETYSARFNVHAYANASVRAITVLEGHLKIAQHENLVFLSPGQQVHFYQDAGIHLTFVRDVETAIAWKKRA